MMVYRISSKKRAHDLSGRGAEIAGGRWNPKGFPVLYTAVNSSLAILETLVHIDMDLLPSNLVLTEIEIPANSSIKTLTKEELPKGWNSSPSPDILRQIGKDWIIENEYLVLQVPSAINPVESNFIINPKHVLFSHVKIVALHDFLLDNRLG